MKAYIVERTDVRKNLDNIKKRAGSAEVIAVLKGDGYGLGLIPMAAVCREAGITRIHHVDYQAKSYVGVYTIYTIIVYGD